jgi:hypothetical protein
MKTRSRFFQNRTARLAAGVFVLLLVFLPVISALTGSQAAAAPAAAPPGRSSSDARCSQVPYGSPDLAHMPASGGQTHGATYVLPPNPNGPTIVDIGLHVMELTAIDESVNTYSIEGFLDIIWCDPREAFDPQETGVEVEFFLEENAHREIEQIWWPDIEIVNQVGPAIIENEELLIYADGTIEYREKFIATLATRYEMRKFPFDTQTLIIEIESFPWSSEHLIFHVEEDIVGFSDEFSIPGWEIIDLKEHITEKQEPRDRTVFSEFLGEITVKRDPGFFVWKLIIPLSIFILLISSVTWIPFKFFHARVTGTFTGLLTSAAYGISVSRFLPAHVYNTYLDAVTLMSFLFAAGMMAENVIVFTIHGSGNEALAHKLDTVTHWLFPLGYIAALFGLYFIYMAG